MLAQDILEAIDGVALIIDQNLIVRRIGWRNWLSFSAKNGGLVNQPAVLGRVITDFFTEGEVRDTYSKLFFDVLARRRPSIQVGYRCDSATLRRSMRLAVTPLEVDGEVQHLLYQSTTLSVEQRPAIPLFEAPAIGSSRVDALKICAVCAKVQWPHAAPGIDAEWIEPQEYYRRGGEDVVLLSHGFCPPCFEVLEAADC